MSKWLRKCIDNLNIEQAKIDMDIKKVEKDIQATENRCFPY